MFRLILIIKKGKKTMCREKNYQNEDVMEQLEEFIPDERLKEFEIKMAALLNDTREEAYLDGYCYAIRLLKDSMVQKDILHKQ